MQRELELSSKRAALVSHSVMQQQREPSYLPSIHEREIQQSQSEASLRERTHSEPSSDAPVKKSKKKRG